MYAYMIRGGVILIASTSFFDLRSNFSPTAVGAQPCARWVGGLVQAAVTPPTPNRPVYDNEVQGDILL